MGGSFVGDVGVLVFRGFGVFGDVSFGSRRLRFRDSGV